MKRSYEALSRYAGVAAALVCVLAIVGFGLALDGYAQTRDPLALLGARGVPRAIGFNLLAWLLPGLLAAWTALSLRAGLPARARWTGRIGTQLLLLSALAFAAQGIWPMDPIDLDAAASRLHATCWTVWWIAFVAGASLLALAARDLPGGRRGAMVAAAAAMGVLVFAAQPLGGLLTPPLAQRLALLAWLGGYAVLPLLRR